MPIFTGRWFPHSSMANIGVIKIGMKGRVAVKKRRYPRQQRNRFPDERILDMLDRISNDEKKELYRRNHKKSSHRNSESSSLSSAWFGHVQEVQDVQNVRDVEVTVSETNNAEEQKASTHEPSQKCSMPKDDRSLIYTDRLADSAVTNEKLASRSVDGSKIQYGSISRDHLADFSVDESKLSDGAVTDSKIVPGSIKEHHLAPESIDGDPSVGRPSIPSI